MSRMDRYKEDDSSFSRLDKNQKLYQNLSSNMAIYTNITDVSNANIYEIDPNKTSITTREAYQKKQKYQDVDSISREKKQLEDFNYFYPKKENKIYDINSVLEEARKNRAEKDVKEEHRSLKNDDYNILAGINIQELEKYREEKKKRLLTPEEEEIRELIDTIASKTLAGEIDKATSVNLLSDLMATSMMDKVSGIKEKEDFQEEGVSTTNLEIKTEEIKLEEEKTEQKDSDFYTRSMDLSDKDFNISDDFKEKSLPLGVKILLYLVLLGIIALAAFVVWGKFK